MLKNVKYLVLILFVITLSSCSKKPTLLMLNWGEYISDDIVENFENEYNCNVKISLADSNENFYAKVKSGTTVYDLVVPSDYMVSKMKNNDLLKEIDFSQIPNYNVNNFLLNVTSMMNNLNQKNPNLSNYYVPYFWGTWGFMYNKTNQSLVSLINQIKINKTENPYKLLFDSSITNNYKVGMYDNLRYVYTATMLYNNANLDVESQDNLNLFYQTLSSVHYDRYGTDDLKKAVANNNLDLAFVWTGDFVDMAITELDGTTNDLSSLNYDIFIPDNTISFMDNLVIPKKSRNFELAYKFINYLLDPNNSYLNAQTIGYCTPYKNTYDKITTYDLQDDHFLINLKNIYLNYYKEEAFTGVMINNYSRDYLVEMNQDYIKAKSK